MGTNKVSPTIIPYRRTTRISSGGRSAYDLRLFLEVLVENREHLAVPENINQAGPGGLPLGFDNGVHRDLNQRTGRIRKAAAGPRLELDGVNRHGYLITNWWQTATHDRSPPPE